MPDIPLRTLGRSRNPRSGYTPLNTEQDEYDANGNNPQTVPSQTAATNAAVSAARRNYQRWKGKKKQTYEDDPEEHKGMMGVTTARVVLGKPVRRGFIPKRHVRPPASPDSVSHRAAINFVVKFQQEASGQSKDKSRTVPFGPPGVFWQ